MKGSPVPSAKHRRPLLGPIILLVSGTLLPLLAGIVLVVVTHRPQCPAGYSQAQVNDANCIIGADMSFIYIILAIPVMILAILVALVWGIIAWRKIKAHD